MKTPEQENLGVYSQTSGIMVSYLPFDHPDSFSFTITVEWRGGERYAVKWGARGCLSTEGTWDYEPLPSSREDDWLDKHRFTRDEAIRLAFEKAPTLKVAGWTVAEVREEWERKDDDHLDPDVAD